VSQARSAASGELSAEGFAGAMEAHSGVSGCYPRLCRVGADAHAVEVHPADRRAVLGLQGLYQAQHAAADHRFELTVRNGSIIRFGSEPVEGSALRVLPAIVVGDRVSKNPVEPGCRRSRAPQGRSMVEASDESLLENVFRIIA
jgi:hypothetical protein